jgi:hypothetical protein
MVNFFGNGLCVHCHLAKNELMDFALFNEQTEEAWKSKDDNLQDELSVILEKHPEKNHADIVESYSWDLHLNQYKYPSLHRESLIITVFNFLEHQLNSLCKIFYESIDSGLKLKDMHGQGVERALLFLSKVAKIDFTSFGSEMPIIKGVNLVRNTIVHNGGQLPDEPKSKVNKFVTSSGHLSGIEGRYINISPEFMGLFIGVLLEFFDRLDHEIQTHIQVFNT